MTKKPKNQQSSDQANFVKRILVLPFLILISIFGLAIFVPGPIQKKSYMGAEYCASCHQKEYQSWLISPHARATNDLPVGELSNPACLSCHATGVFDQELRAFPGVQCEACHGPGEYYASLHVKRDPVLSKLLFMENPATQSCRHCHSDVANLWSHQHVMKKVDWSSKHGGFHRAFHSIKAE